MTRRATRILLEVVAGLLGLILLVTGFAAWRLAQGPVELDFLTPRIQEALESTEEGLQVRIGKTEMLWAGWGQKLDLRAENLWIRNAEQVTVARFPEVEFELSLRALLHGIFIPSEVTVRGASLRFVRSPDGSLHLRGTEPGSDAVQPETAEEEPAEGTDLSRILPRVVEDIISAPNPERPLSYLERFRVVEGRVSVDDRRLNRLWLAPWADITLRSRGGVLAGNAILQVEFAGNVSTLFSRLEYDPLRSEVDLKVDLGGIPLGPLVEDLQKESEPAAGQEDTAQEEPKEELGEEAGETEEQQVPDTPAEPAVVLDLSLFGSIDLVLTLEGRLKHVLFDLNSSVGRLALPQRLPEPLAIRDLVLRGEMDATAPKLSLKEGSFMLARDKLSGPRIHFSAEIAGADPIGSTPEGSTPEGSTLEGDFLAGDLEIAGSAALQNLALSEFSYYWPDGLAPGGRRWVVKNIPAGMAKSAQADFELRLKSGQPRELELRELYGQLAYADLEIHYLRPLPAITGVTGTAEITPGTMTFQAEGGQVEGGLALSQSLVTISGLDEKRQAISVESLIAGPLPAALAIIDHERLDLLSGLGLDPAETSGQAEGALHFDFPLLSDLRFADVQLGVQAEVTEAAAGDLVLGQNLTEGVLMLDVDQESMTVKGKGVLGGVPVEDVVWQEIFSASDPLEREITTRIPKMTVAQIDAFGLDLHDFLAKSFSGDLKYRSETGGKSDIYVTADVTATELRIDPLPWVKPAGEQGTAKVHVSLLDHRPQMLHELAIESVPLSLEANGEFDPESRGFRRLQAPFISYQRNHLEDVSLVWSGPDLAIEAAAGQFDMGMLLAAKEDAPEDTRAAAEEPAEAEGRLHIRAPKLTRVFFGEDRYFDDVSVELLRGSRGWELAAIDARIPQALATPREKNLALDPESPDTRSVSVLFRHNLVEPDDLTVLTHDAGGMLRALDWFDTMSGGRLVVTGDSDAPLPKGPLNMAIEVQDFAAEDVPALARLFTLASLSGPSDLLNGQGLAFERLVGKISLAEHLLKTDLVRAYGSNVGLTATGDADLDAQKVDLRGTLIPAYTINRFIEQIPLIGTLLTGGEGEGVIALTYTMKGDLTDPKIAVNPLSALAPGFLRGLFRGGGSSDGGDAADGEETDIPRALPQRDK